MKRAEFAQLLVSIGTLNYQQRQKLTAMLKQPADKMKAPKFYI